MMSLDMVSVLAPAPAETDLSPSACSICPVVIDVVVAPGGLRGVITRVPGTPVVEVAEVVDCAMAAPVIRPSVAAPASRNLVMGHAFPIFHAREESRGDRDNVARAASFPMTPPPAR